MDVLLTNPATVMNILRWPWFRVLVATLSCTVIDQFIYSFFHDPAVPMGVVTASDRAAYRQRQRQAFNHITRTILDVCFVAYFFIVAGRDLSWIDPFYRNSDTAIGAGLNAHVDAFFQLQLARMLFEMFAYDASLSSVMVGLVRGIHVVIPMSLLFMARGTNSPWSVVHLGVITQMDVVRILVDFKGTGKLPLLQYLFPWWSISIIWMVLRMAIPAYAIYMGRFGFFTGRGAYATIVFFQAMLWMGLPWKEGYYTTTAGQRTNLRQARLRRQQQQQQQ